MKSLKPGLILALALLLAALAPAARADSMYYYTGAAMTSFTGSFSCPTGCSLSGWMDMANPFGANAFSDGTNPVAFSFSLTYAGGTLTFDNNNSYLINNLFTTDGSGQISHWVMSGAMNNNQFTWDQSTNWPQPDITPGDLIQIFNVGQASNAVAGAWSFTAPVTTPEPATAVQLGTGLALLLGLALALERRHRTAAN